MIADISPEQAAAELRKHPQMPESLRREYEARAASRNGQDPEPEPGAIETLKKHPHWVGYRLVPKPDKPGKTDKIPINARTGGQAKVNNPATWGTYDDARRAVDRFDLDGLGFVLTPDLGLICGDLDDCIQDGQIATWALEIVRELDSYTEMSPSGTGLHIWLIGTLPDKGRRKGNIEMYDSGRFITITGQHLEGTPATIEDRDEAINALHKRLWPPKPEAEVKPQVFLLDASDEEILRRAFASRRRGAEIQNLWQGNLNGFSSHSEADLALVNHLLYWTGGDPSQTDRLFRQSGLMREKWDEVHAADGRTYGAMTLHKAMTGRKTGYFQPGQGQARETAGQGKTKPVEDGRGPIHNTDLGNARRLVARHGQKLRYCKPWGRWLIWDGARWAEDRTDEIMRRAKDTVTSMYAEAADIPDGSERKTLAKWAIRSEESRKLNAMIALARSEPGIPVVPDEMDADSWLLNCSNGTLDLQTGELRPHKPSDNISKLLPVAYDPRARCPTWNKFLKDVMGDNSELIQFLQKSVGYSLTGDTSEQCLFILFGTGANGKSVFIETIQRMMGDDYARSTPTETIMFQYDRGIPNDLARLAGVRFVAINEVEENRRMAESLVKQLTGGDTITARFLRAEFFDYRPQFKLFIRANHKPVIKGTDNAIWRRMRLIPFTVTIPEEKQDPHLVDKLRSEWPGILAWAVEGCRKWQEEGLGLPSPVRIATNEYQAEMDTIKQFLDECTYEPTEETSPEDAEKIKVRAGELFQEYKAWCEKAGEKTMNRTRFGRRMTERGYEKKSSNGVWYLRIGLLASDLE